MYQCRFAQDAPTHSKGQRFTTIYQAQEAAENALVAYRDYGLDDPTLFGQLIRTRQQQIGADYAHYQIVRPAPNASCEVIYEGFVAPVVICHTALSEDVVNLSLLVMKLEPHYKHKRPPIADFHRELIKLLKAQRYYSLQHALACVRSLVAIMQAVGTELRPKVADLVATGQGSSNFATSIRGLDRAFLTGRDLDYYLSEVLALVIQKIERDYYPDFYQDAVQLLGDADKEEELRILTNAFHLAL